MPTVLREAGYRFHFYSADRQEPPHVHIDARGRKAKIWLKDGSVAKSGGFTAIELARIAEIVSNHRAGLLEAWNDHFG